MVAIGCGFVGLLTSFKPQGRGHLSSKLLLFIHNLWQSVNRNQQSTVQTAQMCMHITVHNKQYTTEQTHKQTNKDTHVHILFSNNTQPF